MKTVNPNTCALHSIRKLAIALPIYFLLQFYSYYNKANAGVVLSQVYATNGVAGITYNAAFIQLFNVSASPVTGTTHGMMAQIEINSIAQGQYLVHLNNLQGDMQVLRFVKK